jgi:hypothetical protein
MIEAFSIPVLLAAVDFLFDEAREILQERRERRKAQQGAQKAESDETEEIAVQGEMGDVIKSKEAALSQKIDEAQWLDSRGEIEHLLKLLDIYKSRYRLTKEKYARWDRGLVPAHIELELTELEDEIADTTDKLQAAVSRVYGKPIVIS